MKPLRIALEAGQSVIVTMKVSQTVGGNLSEERNVSVEITAPEKTNENVDVTLKGEPRDFNYGTKVPTKEEIDLKKYRIYKVTKSFQGGLNVYYALMLKGLRMKKGNWREQLEQWGEKETDGGFCYGYTMNVKTISKIPEKNKGRLHFQDYLLEQFKSGE